MKNKLYGIAITAFILLWIWVTTLSLKECEAEVTPHASIPVEYQGTVVVDADPANFAFENKFTVIKPDGTLVEFYVYDNLYTKYAVGDTL